MQYYRFGYFQSWRLLNHCCKRNETSKEAERNIRTYVKYKSWAKLWLALNAWIREENQRGKGKDTFLFSFLNFRKRNKIDTIETHRIKFRLLSIARFCEQKRDSIRLFDASFTREFKTMFIYYIYTTIIVTVNRQMICLCNFGRNIYDSLNNLDFCAICLFSFAL